MLWYKILILFIIYYPLRTIFQNSVTVQMFSSDNDIVTAEVRVWILVPQVKAATKLFITVDLQGNMTRRLNIIQTLSGRWGRSSESVGRPARCSIVGRVSMSEVGVATVVLAGMWFGHRSIPGTRIPPSDAPWPFPPIMSVCNMFYPYLIITNP